MDGTHQSAPPPPPPPPPPHGENPKTSSGLPPGNYDIFIIPPHSAGSGFLYLPSLRPQTNSFVAGCVCTLLCVYVWSVLAPTVKAWWIHVSSSGGAVGVGVLALAVGFAGWAFGQQVPLNQQNSGAGGGNAAGAGAQRGHQGGPPPGGFAGAGSPPPNNGYTGTPPPNPGQGYSRPPPGGYGQHQNGSYSRQHSGNYGDSTYGARTPPPWEEPDPFERYGRQKARTQPPGSEPDSERPNPRPRAYSNASANWQKAREKVARENEERKRAEEEKKRAEEERKKKEEAEKAARAAAEKERWEQMRQREKEQREREARERIARERLAKEKEKIEKERKEKEEKEKVEREARIKAARDRVEQAKSERSTPVYGVGERTNLYSFDGASSPKVPNPTASEPAKKTYEKPSVKSNAGTSTAESFRPYDTPRMPKHQPSTSTFYSSEYSYAPSQSTAPTSPPASHRGPYRTSDPEKVVIKGVFQFTDSFPKPVSTLISGQDGLTDGLVLRITTEGMFVDDDVKQQGLRQWDVKAWTMKGIETTTKNNIHILRTLIRDAEGKKYVYIIPEEETWKVVEGIQRLKRGSLVRSCGTGALNSSEAVRLLNMLGFA